MRGKLMMSSKPMLAHRNMSRKLVRSWVHTLSPTFFTGKIYSLWIRRYSAPSQSRYTSAIAARASNYERKRK
jgi:hypothetical protein